MLFNRYFFIFVFSILFLGVVFWWQSPGTAVSAMATGENKSDSYGVVKTFFQRIDYRQFDLADNLTTLAAKKDIADLEKRLRENPFLSIQRIYIEQGGAANSYIVTLSLGSSIDEKQTVQYAVQVQPTEKGMCLTSVKMLL